MATRGKPLPTFQAGAKQALANAQLRNNLHKATSTIRAKRARVVEEMDDWEALREAGRAIKAHTLRHLDEYLLQLEASVSRAGGQVHWARDAAEANRIVSDLVRAAGTSEVVKVKSLTTDETGLNAALAEVDIDATETDLAELIIQLAHESSSHILVPAIHKNRSEIRELFRRTIAQGQHLTDNPKDLTAAARVHLRRKSLSAQVAISGANFAVAETGTICVVESEGNGRMCLTLPRVLITVMGIEKVIPLFRDLEVFLQLLPRSSTGERMNPYTSLWTGVTPGDGPQEFHLVLLDTSDGVLTGCCLAIAQTGTIMLDGGARQGRRVLSLVPDQHFCVIEEAQIVGLLPEAIARLVGNRTRPITFISGPSATSDIELNRVEGVYGPRMLYVFVIEGESR